MTMAVAVPGRAHREGKHERALMNARSARAHACFFGSVGLHKHTRVTRRVEWQ